MNRDTDNAAKRRWWVDELAVSRGNPAPVRSHRALEARDVRFSLVVFAALLAAFLAGALGGLAIA